MCNKTHYYSVQAALLHGGSPDHIPSLLCMESVSPTSEEGRPHSGEGKVFAGAGREFLSA